MLRDIGGDRHFKSGAGRNPSGQQLGFDGIDRLDAPLPPIHDWGEASDPDGSV